MTAPVTIGNMALSILGDEATITSFDPPEGSVQAARVAQFYDIARDEALNYFPWGFAQRSGDLTLRSDSFVGWTYAYDLPSNCLKMLAVMPQNAQDRYSVGYLSGLNLYSLSHDGILAQPTPIGYASHQPQAFEIRSTSTGATVVLTDLAEAEGVWVYRNEDSSKYSPLFINALATLLASKIAGSIIRGKEGLQLASGLRKEAYMLLGEAATLDANQTQETVQPAPPHIVGR